MNFVFSRKAQEIKDRNAHFVFLQINMCIVETKKKRLIENIVGDFLSPDLKILSFFEPLIMSEI